MATTYKSLPNQTIPDIVLMTTGSIEAANQFMLDNNVGITDVPAVNTMFVVSDAAIAAGDAGMVMILQKQGVVIATLDVGYTPLLNDDESPLLNDDGTGLFADN